MKKHVQAIAIRRLLELVRTDWAALPEWVKAAYESGSLVFAPDHVMVRVEKKRIETGYQTDWLIKEQDGTLHTCNALMFSALYIQKD